MIYIPSKIPGTKDVHSEYRSTDKGCTFLASLYKEAYKVMGTPKRCTQPVLGILSDL